MNYVSGVIGCPKLNRAVDIPTEALSTFNLVLDEKKEWLVGLDQSTSCTGIALLAKDLDYVILLDVKRDKRMQKEVYYRELKYLLRRLFKSQKINMLIMEKPVPSKYRSAGDVLREFKGYVSAWLDEIPELEETLFDSLFPQSWKSLVLDPQKGKGRFKDKTCTADDLCDLFPCIRSYFVRYPYTDYDSFDALGIIYGYLRYAFTPDGVPMICGSKENSHTSFVGYCWVPIEWIHSGKVLKQILGFCCNAYKPRFLAYNLSYNRYENIRMASSNNDIIYTILPESELLDMQWRYGIDPDDKNHVMLMFVIRKGAYTKGELKTLEGILKWNELVYGK